MKTILYFLVGILIVACGNSIEKPKNLIDEDEMVDILYDAAILEAMRTQNPQLLTVNKINPGTYLYKKYKIDSLQFAQSHHYYASDVERYKKMYDKVSQRIEKNRKVADSLSGRGPSVPDLPPPPVQ